MTALKNLVPDSSEQEPLKFRNWFHAYDVGLEKGLEKGREEGALQTAIRTVERLAPELLPQARVAGDSAAVIQLLEEHLKRR